MSKSPLPPNLMLFSLPIRACVKRFIPLLYIGFCGFLLLAPGKPGLYAQTTPAQSLYRKLTLSDFKGTPDANAPYLATTFTNLSYQYANPVACGNKAKVRFGFETTIRVGEKSWMKFDKIRSKQLLRELLEHEQGHYDLAETFSVQLQRNLAGFCFDRNRYKAEIDSIYRSLSTYYDTLQVRYDAETTHGQEKEPQAQWKARIDALHRAMLRQ